MFEAELRGDDPAATLAERTVDADPPVRAYTAELVKGVLSHGSDIDAAISASLAQGWTLARMPRVDRNLARIAVYEAVYGQIPATVAVAQAVGLAGELSTDESPTFLNGVLTRAMDR